MTCDERKDLILEYAADALDDAAAGEELRAHLASGCPACAAALAEAEATVAHLPLTLPPVAAPSVARDRLMQRVLASENVGPSSNRSSIARNVIGIFASLAAIIAIVIAVQYQRRDQQYRSQIVSMNIAVDQLESQLRDRDLQVSVIQQTLAEARQSNEILNARSLQLVSMAGDVEQPQAVGRVLYDRDNHKWHVSVFNLKPLPAEQAYELWFIAPGKDPVPAPLIPIDKNGDGNIIVDVPQNIGNISVAAITIEKAGGDTSPHSKPQLVGKVQ